MVGIGGGGGGVCVGSGLGAAGNVAVTNPGVAVNVLWFSSSTSQPEVTITRKISRAQFL